MAVVVTGKIVLFDRENEKYFLPRNYIPYLIPGKNNIALLSRMMLVMGKTYEELLNCFKNGGGIPYSSFNGFYSLSSEMSHKRHKEELIQHFIPSIEGM